MTDTFFLCKASKAVAVDDGDVSLPSSSSDSSNSSDEETTEKIISKFKQFKNKQKKQTGTPQKVILLLKFRY